VIPPLVGASFQNGDGGPEDAAGGHRNEAFTACPEDLREGSHGAKPTVVGVALKHKHRAYTERR
jgi:hypothetical protein